MFLSSLKIADLICLDTLGWIICSCVPQILC